MWVAGIDGFRGLDGLPMLVSELPIRVTQLDAEVGACEWLAN